MPYDQFITDSAKRYGVDLSTARVDRDGVLRAKVCPPMTEGHWESTEQGWVHVKESRRSVGDIWASGNL